MGEPSAEEALAVTFVDRLVPGRFDEARRMVHPSCEYAFGGQVLRGDGVIAAFERSHEEALTKLDRIDYLPARVAHVLDGVVVVQVFDRLELGGRTHTYSDRLVVTVDASANPPILRIEHRPFPEEREALAKFIAEGGGSR